jgi:hypothetical protein
MILDRRFGLSFEIMEALHWMLCVNSPTTTKRSFAASKFVCGGRYQKPALWPRTGIPMITILKRTIEEHGIEAGLLGISFARWEADKFWDKPSDDALSIVSIVMEIGEVPNVAVRSTQAAKRAGDNYQTNDARLEAVRFKINLISETLKEFQKYFDAQSYQRS